MTEWNHWVWRSGFGLGKAASGDFRTHALREENGQSTKLAASQREDEGAVEHLHCEWSWLFSITHGEGETIWLVLIAVWNHTHLYTFCIWSAFWSLSVVNVITKSHVTVQPALPGSQEILKKWRIFLQRTCNSISAKVIDYFRYFDSLGWFLYSFMLAIKTWTFDAFGHKV